MGTIDGYSITTTNDAKPLSSAKWTISMISKFSQEMISGKKLKKKNMFGYEYIKI